MYNIGNNVVFGCDSGKYIIIYVHVFIIKTPLSAYNIIFHLIDIRCVILA